MACRVCGAEPRDGARFCDSCGTALSHAERAAEYKQVTVLFADVVHSMDIAAAVGTERLREVMTEVFNRSAEVVERYGGTVDKFTGDGMMAVFGAPIALEDHALRACRAALDIQAAASLLATVVGRRDEIDLRLRVGLNSGEVIAGEIGSGPLAYTAVGDQVGMAQRMESVAPPGEVMLSESTARLVEDAVALGEVELVRIKGAVAPVPARRLLELSASRRMGSNESTFVGRDWELGALRGLLDRSINGSGSVVGVVGPPGIGKSRIVRELTALARESGVDVFAAQCESHTTDLAMHAATGLLRATAGVDGLDRAAARVALALRFAGADAEDLVLLEDLLGISDSDVTLPQIDPDARRRRVAATISAASLARETPAVFVLEDAHWIDEVSESMLAEFLTVVPQTRSLVLITYRPEYDGTLARTPRSQTIMLEPLDESDVAALSAELLGVDSSVGELAGVIADRAAGNPFFVEELIRDLSERGVLVGTTGDYACVDPVTDVSVPSTLKSVIAARIDRLGPAAKRTLNAASVVGSRFRPDVLRALDVAPDLDDLIRAELIDQTGFGARSEYAFRHPLIRAVAYESQLKSDRAQLHRRLAASIDQDDQNAALIAEHLEAAGDLAAAYDWHMRAASWSTNRDIAAAHMSWERARVAADRLPTDHPGRASMRLAPRTLVCGTAFRRFHPDLEARFDEMRELCLESGDKASLAIGMSGMTVEHVLRGRLWDAARLASEHMALVESLNDPNLTVGLSHSAIVAKQQTCELSDILRWTDAVIELATRDPTIGTFILGSPLSAALVWRGVARWSAGERGWRADLDRASEIARDGDSLARATVVAYGHFGVSCGVLLADDAALRKIEAALRYAERSSDDMALMLLGMMFGVALVHHGEDRTAGFERIRQLRETCVEQRFAMNIVPFLDSYVALDIAERGEPDRAIARLRTLVDEMLRDGHITNVEVTLSFLAEVLLAQGRTDEAADVVERLAGLHPGVVWATRDVLVLGLRARLALGRGDSAYAELRERYRERAVQLGFEGHVVAAEALPR